MVPSYSAMRSLKTREASVCGQPLTGSSSLTPMGTPPKGRRTSAACADVRACSSSMKQTAFSDDAAMAANEPSRASVGDSSPARKASTREQASPNQGSPVTPVRLLTEPPGLDIAHGLARSHNQWHRGGRGTGPGNPAPGLPQRSWAGAGAAR